MNKVSEFEAIPRLVSSDKQSMINNSQKLKEVSEPNIIANTLVPSKEQVPPNSELWAVIVKPVAMKIIGLVFVVIILPFIIAIINIFCLCHSGSDPRATIDFLERWSSMILAPVIGLVGIVVGYYFGTSGTTK